MSNRWEILDLTQLMDASLRPYTEEGYSDPLFRMSDWCSIAERGYSCSKLTMGTQTGTHIDAPAHFVEGAATLDALPLSALMGSYRFIDLDSDADTDCDDSSGDAQNAANILFVTAKSDLVEISASRFETLLLLDCPVWVIVCGIRITGEDPLYMHQQLAESGRFLVEDLELTAARRVRPGGEIIMLPMRLAGAVGSPCRVIVRREKSSDEQEVC